MKHLYLLTAFACISVLFEAMGSQLRELPAVTDKDQIHFIPSSQQSTVAEVPAVNEQLVIFRKVLPQDLVGYDKKSAEAGGSVLSCLSEYVRQQRINSKARAYDLSYFIEKIDSGIYLLHDILQYTEASSELHKAAFREMKSYYNALKDALEDEQSQLSIIALASQEQLVAEVKAIFEFLLTFIEHVRLAPLNFEQFQAFSREFYKQHDLMADHSPEILSAAAKRSYIITKEKLVSQAQKDKLQADVDGEYKRQAPLQSDFDEASYHEGLVYGDKMRQLYTLLARGEFPSKPLADMKALPLRIKNQLSVAALLEPNNVKIYASIRSFYRGAELELRKCPWAAGTQGLNTAKLEKEYALLYQDVRMSSIAVTAGWARWFCKNNALFMKATA